MGATVGNLDIQVQVALAKMEAQFGEMEKKVVAQTASMRRHFATSNAASRGEFAKLSEGVGEHMGKIERQVEHAALHMVGHLTGIGNLARLGVVGGLACGLFKFGEAVSEYAERTRDLDPASERVAHFSDSLGKMWKAVKEGALWVGTHAAAIPMGAGEAIGSAIGAFRPGGQLEQFKREDTLDAAEAQERRRDALFKANPPEKVAALQQRNRETERQIELRGMDAEGRMRALGADIKSFEAEEKKLRLKHEVLKAEEMHSRVIERQKQLEEERTKWLEKHEEAIAKINRQSEEDFDKADRAREKIVDESIKNYQERGKLQEELQDVVDRETAKIRSGSDRANTGAGILGQHGRPGDGHHIENEQLSVLKRIEGLLARKAGAGIDMSRPAGWMF